MRSNIHPLLGISFSSSSSIPARARCWRARVPKKNKTDLDSPILPNFEDEDEDEDENEASHEDGIRQRG